MSIMNTQEKQTNDSSKGIILTESNVIEIYKKLTNNENVDPQEIEDVKKRFYELLNYESGKGVVS